MVKKAACQSPAIRRLAVYRKQQSILTSAVPAIVGELIGNFILWNVVVHIKALRLGR